VKITLTLALVAATAVGCGSGSPQDSTSSRTFSVAKVIEAFREEGLSVADTGLVKPSDRQPVLAQLSGIAPGSRSFDVEVYRSPQLATQFAALNTPPVDGESGHWRSSNVVVYFFPAPSRNTRDPILSAAKRLR
jgi:hypothetical protein